MDELSNKPPEIDELFNQYSGKDDGELMQELIQVIAEQKANGTFNEAELMMMAKRVYQEQGMEQLKAFIVAIEPFVAPNELRTICSSFGLNFESLPRNAKQQQAQTVPGSHAQGSGSRNQMQMLQMLMSMQNMSKGGMDISQLMKMMGGGSR